MREYGTQRNQKTAIITRSKTYRPFFITNLLCIFFAMIAFRTNGVEILLYRISRLPKLVEQAEGSHKTAKTLHMTCRAPEYRKG